MTIRVLVADDQALVRTGFRMILDAHDDLEVVAEAVDGLDAIDAVQRTRPDVVLMDVRMPNLDGVEATRRLSGPGIERPTKVLILTTFDLDEYVFGALEAGASGFLLKDTPPEDLVRAVRVVASGDALVDPAVTRRLIETFVAARTAAGSPGLPATPDHATPAPGAGEPARAVASLTDRELEVLRTIAAGLSNAEIATRLFVSETTVKTHVGHILTKLAVRDRVQAVVFAYEHGIVAPGHPG